MSWSTLFLCVVASIIFLTMIFFIARARDRYDLVDVAWGLVFIAIATVGYIAQPNIELFSIQTLTTLLVIIWGFRLSRHIYGRWSHSRDEDGRYKDMRRQYGKRAGGVAFNMYVRVFLVQALLAVVVSASVVTINIAEPTTLSIFTVVGLFVWIFGFYFESVGDKQLRQHLSNSANKGKIMTTGLWSYTRHPNYFGEAAQWWGIWIIALAVPFGWLSVVGPLTITILLFFISGVPLTEKRFEGRPGWTEYKKRTSVFIPFPPKKV